MSEIKTITVVMVDGTTEKIDAEVTYNSRGEAKFSHPGQKTKYTRQKFLDTRFKLNKEQTKGWKAAYM